MIFSPNTAILDEVRSVLAGHPRIYWILGGACTGKTTVCRGISARTGIPIYDMDAHIYDTYVGRYTLDRHPASKTWISSEDPLEWALSQSWEAFTSVNRARDVEYLDLFAEDMRGKRKADPLLVDGGLTHPSILAQVMPPERIVCLEVEAGVSARLWDSDPGRAPMKRAILALPDPERAWSTFLAFDDLIAETILSESRRAGIAVVHRDHHRDDNASIHDMCVPVMAHLGIKPTGDGPRGGPGTPAQTRLRRLLRWASRSPLAGIRNTWDSMRAPRTSSSSRGRRR